MARLQPCGAENTVASMLLTFDYSMSTLCCLAGQAATQLPGYLLYNYQVLAYAAQCCKAAMRLLLSNMLSSVLGRDFMCGSLPSKPRPMLPFGYR